MRKGFFLLLVVLATGGSLWLLAQPQTQIPFSVLLLPEMRKVADLSRRFLEDIQFKDFKAAARYSPLEEQKSADIPKLIERLFAVKPEFLDIQRFEVLSAYLDSTHRRARVKLLTHVKLLNTNELRKPEVLLYWKKSITGAWEMDLASSLQE
jgi:hypothetical protein